MRTPREALFALGSFVVAAALAFAALSGSNAGPLFEPPPEDESIFSFAFNAEGSVRKPQLRKGDAYHLRFDPYDSRCTIVVAEVLDAGYVMATECEMLAAQAAVWRAAYVGVIGDDLSAIYPDGSMRLYDWPLYDGKSWATWWNGLDGIVITARYDPAIEGPNGPEAGFLLEARYEGEIFLTYDYLPSIRWWTGLRYDTGYGVIVESYERDWTGQALVAEATPLLRQSGGMHVPTTFLVAPEHDKLFLQTYRAGIHAHRPTFVRPDGSTMQHGESASVGGDGSTIELRAAMPGTWRYVPATLAFAGPGVTTVVHGLAFHKYNL